MERNLEFEFLHHCHKDNIEGVTDCLSRGVDVNTVSEDGLDWSDIKFDITANYRNQWTGLMVACEFGNSAIVSRLVQVPGLDINYQNELGENAAHIASKGGQTECVRILAETDRVDWNKRNEYGDTPLYMALEWGHSDTVDIIVQQPNIDYNVRNNDGDTLAQVAVRRGDEKCVETLAAQESCDCWNVPDTYGEIPIMRALYWNKTELVEILLRYPRVDLSCRNKEGWSLVFRAIQRNKLGEKISKCLVFRKSFNLCL